MLAAAAASLAGCAALKDAFKPAPHPWPVSSDQRVHRDGVLLRVYGGSFRDAPSSERDAQGALRSYLQRLEVPGEPADRETRIRKALKLAAPVAGRGPESSYTSTIELPLSALQEILGTRYE
ncbi:MAG: hypothetical protein HY077_17350 [Elusimicrobia bacterium]|nr:hypothetical protein [Elusimicrobiota bacterium]